MRENTVLLDMDGTITSPRQQISDNMLAYISGLSSKAEVGIISGSNIDSMRKQCAEHFANLSISPNVTLYPCNGTKVYRYTDDQYKLFFSDSMVGAIGKDLHNKVIACILKTQSELIKSFSLPVSGHFISNHGSIINWSLIGRDCGNNKEPYFDKTDIDREKLLSRKDYNTIFKYALKSFKRGHGLSSIDLKKIDICLSGQTSFDISPKGWDKTYVLNHISKRHNIWFIGDRCNIGENDYHLYKRLKNSGRAFHTTGPENTLNIIDHILETIDREFEEDPFIELFEEDLIPLD